MSSYQDSLHCNKGFTLLELLASIVILGIILTGFFSFFPQIMNFSNKNSDVIEARNLVQDCLVKITSSKEYFLLEKKIGLDENRNLQGYFTNEQQTSLEVYQDGVFASFPEYRLYIVINRAAYNLFSVHIMVYDNNNRLLAESFEYLKG